jgi:hypothetical protein
MLKPKIKDLLLAWVWHSARAYPLSLAYYESAIYGHIDELVLLSFS